MLLPLVLRNKKSLYFVEIFCGWKFVIHDVNEYCTIICIFRGTEIFGFRFLCDTLNKLPIGILRPLAQGKLSRGPKRNITLCLSKWDVLPKLRINRVISGATGFTSPGRVSFSMEFSGFRRESNRNFCRSRVCYFHPSARSGGFPDSHAMRPFLWA